MSRFRITIAVHELSCALIHFSHARPAQERLTDTILDDQNTKMLHSHLFLPQVNMLYRNAAGHTIVYNVVLLYSEKKERILYTLQYWEDTTMDPHGVWAYPHSY
jgi:hypothetical protein